MKLIIAYLLLTLVAIGYLWSIDLRGLLPSWLAPFSLAYRCALIGTLGGVVYCLRAVYLNKCVYSRWSEDWHVWYYLRPIVSTAAGGVSYVILSAGLLVLDSSQNEHAMPFGYLALAFIAGLNVDRFLHRIEEIAQTAWGIRPSRASRVSEEGDK
jgi:hypothetical protein